MALTYIRLTGFSLGEGKRLRRHRLTGMRVTGGKLGGRRLIAPDDARVRPTSDRTRQAIFNILEHRDFGIGFTVENAAVADLFAGTGALGIEALSRGARFCLLVDDYAESRALQRENVEALGLTGVTKIWRRDATDLGAAWVARRGRAVRSGVSRSALSQKSDRARAEKSARRRLADATRLADVPKTSAKDEDDSTARADFDRIVWTPRELSATTRTIGDLAV